MSASPCSSDAKKLSQVRGKLFAVTGNKKRLLAVCSYFHWKLHRVSEKNKQNYFCYNYVKLPPKLTIF